MTQKSSFFQTNQQFQAPVPVEIQSDRSRELSNDVSPESQDANLVNQNFKNENDTNIPQDDRATNRRESINVIYAKALINRFKNQNNTLVESSKNFYQNLRGTNHMPDDFIHIKKFTNLDAIHQTENNSRKGS